VMHGPMTHCSSIVRGHFHGHLPVFVTYTIIDSGHGGQTKDLDGDEEDGYDEGDDHTLLILQKNMSDSCAIVIYPVDFKQNGHIVDDVRLPLSRVRLLLYYSPSFR
jgi:hypothetical protein